MTWDYANQYPPGHFHLICASVPCTEYSRAKTIGQRNLRAADDLVAVTLQIIDYFQRNMWWIEKPSTSLLKLRERLNVFPYVELVYCQFSEWGYQKPTRFWGSQQFRNLENRQCDRQTCPNLVTQPNGIKRHKFNLGGHDMKFSTKMKGRIPHYLLDYFLSSEPQFQNLLPRHVKFNLPTTQKKSQKITVVEHVSQEKIVKDEN